MPAKKLTAGFRGVIGRIFARNSVGSKAKSFERIHGSLKRKRTPIQWLGLVESRISELDSELIAAQNILEVAKGSAVKTYQARIGKLTASKNSLKTLADYYRKRIKQT
ncbi:hypothetical protein KKG83_03715 [Candidatus Micrarchaeota archaeon]|nr:hypothetical protein [Candidatus Micrarchaeota archaeon]MBU2476552.1 hypothetical protein [Candidatus Micrarchaeota archaeon]